MTNKVYASVYVFLLCVFGLLHGASGSSSSSSSSSQPASVNQLPVAVRQVLRLAVGFDPDSKKETFILQEHALGISDQPPQNSICVRTPQGSVFFVDVATVERIKNLSLVDLVKKVDVSLANFLKTVELGSLRNAQNVPYTDIVRICGHETGLFVLHRDGSCREFNQNGVEVGLIWSNERVFYEYTQQGDYREKLLRRVVDDNTIEEYKIDVGEYGWHHYSYRILDKEGVQRQGGSYCGRRYNENYRGDYKWDIFGKPVGPYPENLELLEFCDRIERFFDVSEKIYTKVKKFFAVSDSLSSSTTEDAAVSGMLAGLVSLSVPRNNFDVCSLVDGKRLASLNTGTGVCTVHIVLNKETETHVASELRKHFGDCTFRKMIFFLAAQKGLLQQTHKISGTGTVSLQAVCSWYKGLSESVRSRLSKQPYNMASAQFILCQKCTMDDVATPNVAVYRCANGFYVCSHCTQESGVGHCPICACPDALVVLE